MDRAEAIELLDRIALRNVFCTLEEDALEAFWMATEAMREQEQREKGCEYCNGSQKPFPVYDNVPYPSYDCIHFDGEKALLEDADGCDILINFCPMCGRKLKEGADG